MSRVHGINGKGVCRGVPLSRILGCRGVHPSVTVGDNGATGSGICFIRHHLSSTSICFLGGRDSETFRSAIQLHASTQRTRC